MNKKLIIIAGLALALSGNLIADATLNKGKEANKLAKMAGEKSPFYRASKESFPKDYFLVSQNLPFLVGISLFHPNSDTLNLDKKQLAAIVKSKETTVPVAVQIAKQIKAMEFKLAIASLDEKKDPKSLNELVEKISKARTDLTKAHLACIHNIQGIFLTSPTKSDQTP